MKRIIQVLVALLACATALGQGSDLGDDPVRFGWRDCFQPDAELSADFEISVEQGDISDRWCEVVYLRAKRSEKELGVAPFFSHQIDHGDSPRAATVHFIPTPKTDGLHVRLTLQWWESGAQKSADGDAVIPYLKDASGVAGPFRFSAIWKKSRANLDGCVRPE